MSNYNNSNGGGARSGGHFGGSKPAFGGGGKRFGGKPSFGAKKSWGGDRGGNDRGNMGMHTASCTVCGKSCEVPFKPMSGKPIYCKDHFISKDGGQSGRRDDRRDDRGGDRFPKRDFGAKFHASSGASAPAFRPAQTVSEKPGHGEAVLKQLEVVSGKLDRLLVAIETLATAKVAASSEVVSTTPEKVKKVAKKKVVKNK